jgi:DNA modification methylase
MPPRQRTAEVSHIKDLVADPANRRRHNPRNIGMVVDALHKVGAARSIVIDEGNVILAGNGVTEAAAEAGITRVRVIDASGDELIAVRRSGLSEAQKRELAIYDNRAAELAEWNPEQLQADIDAGLDLAPWFSESELQAILPVTVKGGLTDPDEVPAERATDIVLGDLFELGRHRLICGDSTNPQHVDRVLVGVKPHLMVTDPPYGVEYDANWRNEADRANGQPYGARAIGLVSNDDRSDWREAWALFPGDVAYVWHAGRHASAVQQSLEACLFKIRCQVIWAKPRFAISRGHYHWQHEPCWYAVKKGGTGHWSGDRSQTTLWTIAHNKSETGHSTQKPVECMRRPIENNSSPGQAVYEPFSGSGTTIIAAEQTGRACHAIEINQSYVQVAIDRWEAFTGQKAQKVGEAVSA